MNQRRSRPRPGALAGAMALSLLLPAGPALAAPGPTGEAAAPVAASAPATQPAPEVQATSPAEPRPPEGGPAPREGAPRLGKVAVSREEAVARVRKLLPIPAELGEPTVNLWQSQGVRANPVWYLNWDSAPGQEPQVQVSVSVDATTGEILSYDVHRMGAETGELTYTRSEARKRAEEWLKRLAGAHVSQLRLEDERSGVSFRFSPGGVLVHSFVWKRVAEGHAVPNQSVTISIDARTGELVYYGLSWDPTVVFRPAEPKVDAAQAEVSFRVAARLGLVYRRFWEAGVEKPVWKLVYAPVYGFPVVDAATGQALTPQGRLAKPIGWEDLRRLPAPAKPYTPPAAPLTQEQALALARAVTGATGEPTQLSYNEQGSPNPGKYFHFSWTPAGRAPRTGEWSFDVAIDAVRGVVHQLNAWTRRPDNWQETPPALDLEKARAAADQFLLKFRPDLAAGLREVPLQEGQGCRLPGAPRPAEDRRPVCEAYEFFYVQLHEGIPIEDQWVTVRVDPWSGRVISFWDGADGPGAGEALPPAKGVIGAEAALEKLLSQAGLELQWLVPPRAGEGPVPLEGAAEKAGEPGPRLVYALGAPEGFAAVDAFTGALLDWAGQDLSRLALEPEDIAGHPAQKEIELLLLRQVLEVEPDGKFYPDRPVTRAEAARWLVLARGLRPYVPVRGQYSFAEYGGGDAVLSPAAKLQAQYAEAALRAGILVKEELGEAFAPDRTVTREEFALWAVRAMGYGAIARMDAAIASPFRDTDAIGARYRNAVALLAGLKVIDGQGAFRPRDPITRAEAARILYAVATQPREP